MSSTPRSSSVHKSSRNQPQRALSFMGRPSSGVLLLRTTTDALMANDLTAYVNVLQCTPVHDLAESWLTLLEKAVVDNREDFIAILFQHGRFDLKNNPTNLEEPLRLYIFEAIEKRKLNVLPTLCIKAGQTKNYSSPINVLPKIIEHSLQYKNVSSREWCDVVDILFEYRNNNILSDVEAEICIYDAAVKHMWWLVECLINHGVRIDREYEIQSTQNILSKWRPELLFPNMHRNNDSLKSQLFNALYDGNENLFIEIFTNNKDCDPNEMDECYTFLQLAVRENLAEVVKFLLKKGAKLNNTLLMSRYQCNPISLSIVRGYSDVLELLLNSDESYDYLMTNVTGHQEILEHITCIANELHLDASPPTEQFMNCMVMLDQKFLVFGKKICSNDIPKYLFLHLPRASKNKNYFTLLLRCGGFHEICKNLDTLSAIDPQAIVYFLDSCITVDETQPVYLEKILTIDYTFMEHPTKVLTPSSSSRNESRDPPETFPFYTLSVSPDHCYVLKHPVIANFLQLKWLKIYLIYFFNLLLFTSFTIAFSCLVFLGPNFEYIQYPQNVCIVLWTILTVRELFQMGTSFKQYISILENWLELFILVSSILVLAIDAVFRFRAIPAITVMAIFVEWTLMMGKHPYASTYVTIFLRVFFRTMRMLILLVPFVWSFAFGFYLLFNDPLKQNLYSNLWYSVLKTLTMATGEFEIDISEFEISPVIGEMVFLGFVVSVSIILMNLLNALAVSDTQFIMDDAEVHSCISKVELYTKVESIWFDYPFYAESVHSKILAKRRNKFNKFCITIFFQCVTRLRSRFNLNILPFFKSPANMENKFEIVESGKASEKFTNSRLSHTKSFLMKWILGLDFKSIFESCYKIHVERSNITDTKVIITKVSEQEQKLDNVVNKITVMLENRLKKVNETSELIKGSLNEQRNSIEILQQCLNTNEKPERFKSIVTIPSSSHDVNIKQETIDLGGQYELIHFHDRIRQLEKTVESIEKGIETLLQRSNQ